MLNFNPQDERWYLLTEGFRGQVKAVPVFNDEAGFVPSIVVSAMGEGTGSIN